MFYPSSATERRSTMAKYMIKASYSPEGIKGVMAKGGSARAEAIEKLAWRWRHSGWRCISRSVLKTFMPSSMRRAMRRWQPSLARSVRQAHSAGTKPSFC